MELTRFSDIPLVGVKNVFIDLDNTLYPYNPAHVFALEACYKAILSICEIEKETFVRLYRDSRDSVLSRLKPQAACRSRLLSFLFMFEKMELKSAYSCAEKFDEIYWSTFIAHMKASDEALHFLHACKDLNIPVCIVTDMITSIQVRKIRKLKIDYLIEKIVTSEECGAEKPDPVMFAAGLRKMDASPDTSIFVGDDYQKDIQGAQACGIKAFLVKL